MFERRSIAEISRDLTNKKYSCTELTQFYLNRIKQFDDKLNSFITITEQQALQQAMQCDRLIQQGKKNVLTGIPLAHKDIFCTKSLKTTCASKMLADFIALYDAEIVMKLQKVDMVMLGKTNMDEFAMGSSGENSYFGAIHNPWRLQMVPGGSSGGSAAAVAAGLVPIATGSDTAGSVRQPAAFCGVTGLKPTYGRISRYGMIAFASTLDHAGLLARSAEDIAIVLEAIAGFDAKDSTSVDLAVPNYQATLNDDLINLRIGLPKEYFSAQLNTDVARKLDEGIKVLTKLGVQFKEISLPHTESAIFVYYVIAPAECCSNLARFDGVRYGYRCANPIDWKDLYMRSRAEGFGAEVKRRILLGTHILSAAGYDSYYLQAQKVRRLLKEDYAKAFTEVDLILGPTTVTTAFEIGAKTKQVLNMYLNDMYTVPANLVGLPALSFPIGFSKGLPVGMQLIGNYFAEAKILNVAHQYQKITDWHTIMPNFKIK